MRFFTQAYSTVFFSNSHHCFWLLLATVIGFGAKPLLDGKIINTHTKALHDQGRPVCLKT